MATRGFMLLCASLLATLILCSSVSATPLLKLELSMRNVTCDLQASDTQDPVLSRVSCMAKKSNVRANKVGQALRTKLSAGAISMIADSISTSTGVSTDYESPVASGGGDYVTTISLGTPAETFTVIADTGSDLIWIQCQPCTACFNQDEPIFDPTDSSTYSTASCQDNMCSALPRKSCSTDKTCEYSYSYGDGSGSRGTLSTDSVTLTTTDGESVQVKKIAFGCGHTNRGSFLDSSGLLGLGRGKLSFVSQLGDLFGNKFSYCLVPWRSDRSKTSPMFFGEAATSFKPSKSVKAQYTPMVQNPVMETFYYVTLKDISVGGRALNIPAGSFDLRSDGSGGLIFDSGTTLTLLQDKPYQMVLQALKSKITGLPRVDGSSAGLDLCYNISKAKSSYKKRIPSLTFHFQDAEYILPVENYFIQANKAGTVLCLAMASSNMDIGIFGNMMQQNFHVVYDMENTRIGWAPANCESSAFQI